MFDMFNMGCSGRDYSDRYPRSIRHEFIMPGGWKVKSLVNLSDDFFKGITNKHTMQNQTEEKAAFEIKVMFPVNHGDIYDNHKHGHGYMVGIVSAERAKEIYDTIGRQLKGLALTAPKAKPVKKGRKK